MNVGYCSDCRCSFNTDKLIKIGNRAYKCPSIKCDGEIFDVDEFMLPIIDHLVKNKVKTLHSCSGHVFKSVKNNPYIQFPIMLDKMYRQEEILNQLNTHTKEPARFQFFDQKSYGKLVGHNSIVLRTDMKKPEITFRFILETLIEFERILVIPEVLSLLKEAGDGQIKTFPRLKQPLEQERSIEDPNVSFDSQPTRDESVIGKGTKIEEPPFEVVDTMPIIQMHNNMSEEVPSNDTNSNLPITNTKTPMPKVKPTKDENRTNEKNKEVAQERGFTTYIQPIDCVPFTPDIKFSNQNTFDGYIGLKSLKNDDTSTSTEVSVSLLQSKLSRYGKE